MTGPGGGEVWAASTASRGDATESSLIAVPLDGSGAVRTLLRTPRRIAAPRASPDGSLLGGPAEAACHPEWASDRSLYAVSDRSHWQNLCEVRLEGVLRPLCLWEEEFGCPLADCARDRRRAPPARPPRSWPAPQTDSTGSSRI